MAEVDGGITVKTFFRDERGDVWLLPRNEKYMPIHLTEDMNARVVGKVIEIRRVAPHTSMSEMMRIMKREVRQESVQPSARAVKSAIVKVAERVTNGRLWFAAITDCHLSEWIQTLEPRTGAVFLAQSSSMQFYPLTI